MRRTLLPTGFPGNRDRPRKAADRSDDGGGNALDCGGVSGLRACDGRPDARAGANRPVAGARNPGSRCSLGRNSYRSSPGRHRRGSRKGGGRSRSPVTGPAELDRSPPGRDSGAGFAADRRRRAPGGSAVMTPAPHRGGYPFATRTSDPRPEKQRPSGAVCETRLRAAPGLPESMDSLWTAAGRARPQSAHSPLDNPPASSTGRASVRGCPQPLGQPRGTPEAGRSSLLGLSIPPAAHDDGDQDPELYQAGSPRPERAAYDGGLMRCSLESRAFGAPATAEKGLQPLPVRLHEILNVGR